MYMLMNKYNVKLSIYSRCSLVKQTVILEIWLDNHIDLSNLEY